MATFALLRAGSLNVSAAFRSQDEALEAIRQALVQGERELVLETTLYRVDRATWQPLVEGAELLALAERATPSRDQHGHAA